MKEEEIPSVSAVPSLVDTSVIIDGRIADIARAGFAPGQLLIPRFVLAELQLIADSGDAMKRSRGRRGLEMLHGMREAGVDMEVIEYDYDDIKEVDAKLVRLGRHLKCNVLTTDYNLNRVASIEGVRVLNINELANAVRPVILPGERMHTKIVQPGKEKTQGVGYLADGTMIVVDGGDKLIGQDVEVEITRVFQTVAGKMLFAVVKGSNAPRGGGGDRSHDRPQGRPKAPASVHKPGGPRSNRDRGNQRPADPAPRRPNQPHNLQLPPAPAAANVPETTALSQPKRPRGNPNSNAKPGNNRRPKRVSPTQRLEDSLLEMTNGSNDSTPPTPKN